MLASPVWTVTLAKPQMACPHSQQDEANLHLCAGDKSFCLINDEDNVMLDKNHDDYHQVQAQLHVVDAAYCDFVVWNCSDIFVERFCLILNFRMM
ncbi:hypothetical protein NL108_017090 [Boleophthalmus pectinirostris]|nr:hypothetical protein NL108_017090 [Boleophthalmus pectinirostris]